MRQQPIYSDRKMFAIYYVYLKDKYYELRNEWLESVQDDDKTYEEGMPYPDCLTLPEVLKKELKKRCTEFLCIDDPELPIVEATEIVDEWTDEEILEEFMYKDPRLSLNGFTQLLLRAYSLARFNEILDYAQNIYEGGEWGFLAGGADCPYPIAKA